MAQDDMSSRISRLKALLPTLESRLTAFTSSEATFALVRYVDPAYPVVASSSPPQLPSHPGTLLVLDSSFNPPSLAHSALAVRALANTRLPRPHRLLLLLSTSNADKAPKPASFLHRLAMMTLFAEDLQVALARRRAVEDVPIDVGLTTCPFYTDKSTAIATASPAVYASRPPQVFLLGYDTLIRFLAPKYYAAKFNPPLTAVAPFFEAGHALQVLLRPGDGAEGEGPEGLRHQWAYLAGLRDGALAEEGFESGWADQISGMEPSRDTDKVSSTKIRAAAQRGAWDEVGEMCSAGVTEWIRDQNLYDEAA